MLSSTPDLFLFVLQFQTDHICSSITCERATEGSTSGRTTTPRCCDAPCFQPITALCVASEEVATLFWTLAGHVEARGNCCGLTAARKLRIFTSSSAALSATTRSDFPRQVRDVRGEPDHQEPGYPGRQAGRHPRLCSHAPGLLHDSWRDYVQHYAWR